MVFIVRAKDPVTKEIRTYETGNYINALRKFRFFYIEGYQHIVVVYRGV